MGEEMNQLDLFGDVKKEVTKKKKSVFALTADHIDNNKFLTDPSRIDAFARKVIYFDPNIAGNRSCLYQMAGHLSGLSEDDINAPIDVFVISDHSYQELAKGYKNEMLIRIEKLIQKSQRVNIIPMRFVIESEFLDYFHQRLNNVPDQVVIGNYEKYMQSRKQ